MTNAWGTTPRMGRPGAWLTHGDETLAAFDSLVIAKRIADGMNQNRELLAACEELLRYHIECSGDKVAERARAAIANARGPK